jgi:hypothetical protein
LVIPELIKEVFPGLLLLHDGVVAAGVKSTSGEAAWAKAAKVSETSRTYPLGWPHIPNGVNLLFPAKGDSVFVHVQWNFGSGLHAKIPLKVLGMSSKSSTFTLECPAWLGIGKETLSVGSCQIACKVMGKKGLVLVNGQGIVISPILPLTGFSNETHESLLMELTQCL